MKQLLYTIVCLSLLVVSCDDNTDTLGSSLTNAEDIIHVTDNVFRVQSRSVKVDSVLSRNTLGYLGLVKDTETGAYIKSDFVTQFHIPEYSAFPPVDTLAHGIKADSCSMRLFYTEFYGDSLASMKATVYELSRPIEENALFYNNFDPEREGYIRLGEGAIQCTKAYTLVNKNLSDSVLSDANYTNNIVFRFNQPYTSREGRQYDNYGTYIMDRYYANPDDFKNSYNFSHRVCPGFYVKLENGVGSMAYIRSSQLDVYYTYRDTTEHMGDMSIAGTEEVRQVTRIVSDQANIQALVDDNSCTYVKSPAGIFTELTLPVEEICDGHETDSINSAKIVLKTFNRVDDSQYAFNAPTTLLMIRPADVKEFFERSKVANHRTSFVSTFSGTDNTYTFGNVSNLVRTMFDSLPADRAQREAYKQQHPDWNRVLLIPVNAGYTQYNSTTILSSVAHDMSLSSVKLVGGSQSQNGEISISVIYSKFNH